MIADMDWNAAGVQAGPELPPAVRAYLADVIATCTTQDGSLMSLVLFGSAGTGGYVATVSDVDLLLVLRDDADQAERHRIRDAVAELEVRHGLAKTRPRRGGAIANTLRRFAERVTANVRAFFVCTRADLVSGDPARVLGIARSQARFVDRIAIPSIVASGTTVWGEELLATVPLPRIRRVDVAKAFFGLFNQALFTATVYPVLPEATKYAMDALKRSLHSCYFCYHARAAPLVVEVAFFDRRYGPSVTLARLLALRREYEPSFGFILRCLPTIALLHLRTARDVQFPREARAAGGPSPGAHAL
jgi:hypothetical protein